MYSLFNQNQAAAFSWISGFTWALDLCIFILTVIGLWRIFTKAGEKGWKAIIPIYDLYIVFKICWKTSMFWWTFALCLIVGFCTGISYTKFLAIPFSAVIQGIASIVLIIFIIMLFYHLCKAFGHGGGWTVGLVFLEPVFIMMIGFGKSQYKGNIYLQEKVNK